MPKHSYNNRVGPQGASTEPMGVPGSARDYDKGEGSPSEAPMTKHGVEAGSTPTANGTACVYVEGPGGSADGWAVDESRWGSGASANKGGSSNKDTPGYVENKTVRAGNQGKQYGKGETRGG